MKKSAINEELIGVKELSRTDYLYIFRKFSKLTTLESFVAHKECSLAGNQLCNFYTAADHRRVEIIMNKLFDKIPKSCWHLIK